MDSLDRLMIQRAEAQKALGHLWAISEYFYSTKPDDLKIWSDKIKEIEEWIYEISPIA